MAVDVHPIPREDMGLETRGKHPTYTIADLEAMIEMLEQEPVLLGNAPTEREIQARGRARNLRERLLEMGLKVTSRTWPEIVYDGDEQRVVWRWCVILKNQAADA